MKKWEYLTLQDLVNYELDDCGKKGWELVAVSVVGNTEWLYFKRPLKEEVPEEQLREILK